MTFLLKHLGLRCIFSSKYNVKLARAENINYTYLLQNNKVI